VFREVALRTPQSKLPQRYLGWGVAQGEAEGAIGLLPDEEPSLLSGN
jgi:hypothetical protein